MAPSGGFPYFPQFGSVTLGQSNLVMTGAQSATTTLLYSPGTTISGAPSTAPNGIITPAGIYLAGDQVDTITNGNGNLIGFSVLDGMQAGWSGGRTAIQGELSIVGADSALNGVGEVGVAGLVTTNQNLGGTTGAFTNGKGQIYGMNPYCQMRSGATFYSVCNGMEVDTSIATGSSVYDHFGMSIVETSVHAVQGTTDDAGIVFANQPTVTAGWKFGLLFGDLAHLWSFTATSTLIGAEVQNIGGAGSNTALNGVDFRNVLFQSGGFAFASTGFSVDPSGNLTSANIHGPQVVQTTAQTSRSGPTLSNDATFTIAIAAAGTYQFRIDAMLQNNAVSAGTVTYNINYSGTFTGGTFNGSGAFAGTIGAGSGAAISSTVAGSPLNVTTGSFGAAGGVVGGSIMGTVIATGAGTLSFSWGCSVNGFGFGNGSFVVTRIA